MKQLVKRFGPALVLAGLLAMLAGMNVVASDDNSLADLGIKTEGATVTPEFSYDTWTYDVTVPAGTTELALDPVPSSDSATIAEITGTTLNEDGTSTVYITVQAQTGAQFTYTLNVTGGGGAAAQPETPAPVPETQPATEPPTEKATEPPTEPQTEDSRFVRVDKNTIQEAENTITNLKGDIAKYQDTISLYTKIIYGLIAVAVLLLFIVINLILRKRDLKAELNDYRSLSAKKNKKQPYKGGAQGRPVPPANKAGKNARAQKTNAPAGNAPVSSAAQGMPANGPVGQVSGQMQGANVRYRALGSGLDVQPQTSSRRKLPEYQKEGVQDPGRSAGNENAPAAPQQGTQPQGMAQPGTPQQGAAQSGTPQPGAPASKPSGAGSVPENAPATPAMSGTGANTNAPTGQESTGGGGNRNVEVDMIEL